MNTRSIASRRMRNIALVAAVAIAATASGAQSWSASGTVNTAAGAALSGVSVTIKDSSAYSTTTNSSGAFTIQSTSGVLGANASGAFSLRMAGPEMVFQGPADGVVGFSLVNGAGRTVWSVSTQARQGEARAAIPSGIGHGAAFLRVRHEGGEFVQAVTTGPEGMKVAKHVLAMRTMANNPVLVFKKTGYRDTTYAMTAASQSNIAVVMAPVEQTTCDLPTTFKWKDYGKPVAEPKNGWLAIKDFTMVRYNNQYIVYMTYTPSGGGFKAAYMAPFSDFAQANASTQAVMPNNLPGVAPELIYFTPKKQWIFTTQWCGGGFCYTTGSDPTKPTSFSATTQSLLSENITTAGNPLEGNKGSDTGPIDQVVICDDDNCYLFYNDDNGRVYRASMPKASFPGKFSGSKEILRDTKTRLFEAIEVYKLKGQKKYLMIVECAWTRYFRAYTATDLGGTWTPLGNTREEATPFAGAKNVTGGWSTDISHGEIVRTGNDEYREIDPCNLQMIYQGKNGGGDYDKLPYRMGLLTLVR